jgi:radical SAM superfamily enzyme YgiQ (UPF0313 family)
VGFGTTANLAMGYLSSYVKAGGYNALIIDGKRDKLSNGEILAILQKQNIKAAGLTCLSAYYNEVVELSKQLKENGITVIIGGIHPTFFPYQTLVESKADYVCCGEGEIPLLALLKNNMNNVIRDGNEVTTIKGVYSLNELKDKNTPYGRSDSIENLDDIPYPDWEQLQPASRKYQTQNGLSKGYPAVGIFTSRGCPFPCKFCASPNFYQKKIRFRSAENIIGEIKLLTEKYGIKEIQFLDDNITLERTHIESLCDAMLKNNIRVPFCCPNGIRADKIDDTMVKLMKKAGFYSTNLGIESANAEILKNIRKSESIDTIQNAITILRKNRIVVGGFFIFGLPGETKETIKETLDFALHSGLDIAFFGIFSVLPGSDYWNELQGDFKSSSHIDPANPAWVTQGLTKEYLIKAQIRAYRKFSLTPQRILGALRQSNPRDIFVLIRNFWINILGIRRKNR